jgi:O-antigen ligase
VRVRRKVITRPTPVLARFTLVCLCLTLALTQWAFGGIHAWAYAKVAAALSFLVCLLMPFVLLRASRADLPALGLHIPPLMGHALLFLAVAAIQLAPLPVALVEAISPPRMAVYVPPLVTPSLAALSLDAHAGMVELFKFIPLPLTFLLAVYAIRTSAQAVKVVWFLLFLGLFQAGYGILQTFGGSELVWYWPKTAYRGFVTGTYISRNALAYFLEISVLTTIGTAIGLHLHARRDRVGVLDENTWKAALMGFFGVLLAVALLLTGSRGGILSCSLGFVGMSGLFLSRRITRPAGWKLLGAAALILAYGLGAGLEKTAARFEHDGDLVHRLEIAASVLPMIADHPWAGVGLGAFNTAYGAYALPVYGADLDAVHAHNDWVEVAAETGLPGLLLCASGFALFLFRCLRRWRRHGHPLVIGLGAGVLGSLLSLGAHSFFDFGMRIPANILAVGLVCGLLWTTLHMRGESALTVALPRRNAEKPWRAATALCALLVFAAAGGFGLKALDHDRAERLCPTERTIFPAPYPALDRIQAALALDPDNPRYLAAMAGRIMQLFLEAKLPPRQALGLAEKYYRESLHKDPANGLTWRQYARVLGLGEEYALGHEWRENARAAHDRALGLRPQDPRTALDAARHELWSSAARRGGSRERGLELLATAMRLSPRSWQEALDMGLDYGADPEELFRLLPDGGTKRQKDYILIKTRKS